MYRVAFGLTIVLFTILPTSYFARILSGGGMYGSIFKSYPPSAYITLNLILSLIIPFIISMIFIKKADVLNRLPNPIPGQTLMLLGGIFILAPFFLRIFTSMIQGGGATFALFTVAAPFIVVAKFILYIGLIQLLMAIKPNEKYVYPDNNT